MIQYVSDIDIDNFNIIDVNFYKDINGFFRINIKKYTDTSKGYFDTILAFLAFTEKEALNKVNNIKKLKN